MDPKVSKELATISQKLQVGVEHLWEISVRQAYISGISDVIIGIVCILFLVCFWKWIKANGKDPDFLDDGSNIFGLILGTSLSVITVLVLIVGLEDTITKLLNPEYAAFQGIMKLLHPTK